MRALLISEPGSSHFKQMNSLSSVPYSTGICVRFPSWAALSSKNGGVQTQDVPNQKTMRDIHRTSDFSPSPYPKLPLPSALYTLA